MRLDSKTIDYSREYSKAKTIVVAVCVASMLLSVYIIKSGLDQAEECRNSIFVADDNNTLLLALANDVDLNAPNEAKASLKRMHHYLFNMSPTASYINESIRKAENLSDQSVLQYVEKMKEKGWYNKMIAEGISTEFMCDSLRVAPSDDDRYDYKAELYGKRSLIHPDKIEFRRIKTSCYLTDTERTIDNPNGFTVSQWRIVREETLKILVRTQVKTVTDKEESVNPDSVSAVK